MNALQHQKVLLGVSDLTIPEFHVIQNSIVARKIVKFSYLVILCQWFEG
jgi:hypothetical protein